MQKRDITYSHRSATVSFSSEPPPQLVKRFGEYQRGYISSGNCHGAIPNEPCTFLKRALNIRKRAPYIYSKLASRENKKNEEKFHSQCHCFLSIFMDSHGICESLKMQN